MSLSRYVSAAYCESWRSAPFISKEEGRMRKQKAEMLTRWLREGGARNDFEDVWWVVTVGAARLDLVPPPKPTVALESLAERIEALERLAPKPSMPKPIRFGG